jgi:ribose transport system permease protein
VNRATLQRILREHPYLFTLLLFVVLLIANRLLQDNLFEGRVLSGNFRTLLPLLILAVGQTFVVIAGGIDLSVGAIVSLATAVLVTNLLPESNFGAFLGVVGLAAAAGMAAGALNGFCVAVLRLQPIVTTYATSFLFSGIALWLLPRPGGAMPQAIAQFYRREMPLGLPIGVYVIAALLLVWILLRATRYGRYLFAVGGQPDAAYASGVPVTAVRVSTYMLSGLFAALAAVALTLGTSSGDPRIGDAMTLDSIVAVVLGGTRLSGGQGGIAGTVLGVIVLSLIRNIISFANVPNWWQTLVDALIIVLALALPGLVRLLRRRKQ